MPRYILNSPFHPRFILPITLTNTLTITLTLSPHPRIHVITHAHSPSLTLSLSHPPSHPPPSLTPPSSLTPSHPPPNPLTPLTPTHPLTLTHPLTYPITTPSPSPHQAGWGRLSIGLYAVYLEKWLEHFAPDQFLITRLEDYENDPKAYMQRLFVFLGVQSDELEQGRG